jgi:protease-4
MSHLTLLRKVIGGHWLIDKSAAEAYMPAVLQLITGQEVTAFQNDTEKSPFYMTVDNPDFRVESEFRNVKVPEGSIAVIPVQGALMKEDYCGEPGTATMGRWIRNAQSNPNIIGIILDVDSPGGHVDGTEELARVIGECTKPVVSFTDGMMASAAYWIGSSADFIIAQGKTNLIGSIGTQVTIRDYSKYYEKFGLKTHDIQADKSKDKNRIAREVFNDNYKPIKEEILNPMNEVFLENVEKNRKGKLSKQNDEPLTGKVYLADAAISMGLIDARGTFKDAIEKVKSLSENSNTQTMFNNKFTALTAIAAKQKKGEAPTAEEINAANEELTQAGITGLVLAESSHIEQLTTANTTFAENHTAAVHALDPEATEESIEAFDVPAAITALNEELTEANAEVKKLGAQAPKVIKAKKTSAKTEVEEEKPEEEFYSETDAQLEAELKIINGTD